MGFPGIAQVRWEFLCLRKGWRFPHIRLLGRREATLVQSLVASAFKRYLRKSNADFRVFLSDYLDQVPHPIPEEGHAVQVGNYQLVPATFGKLMKQKGLGIILGILPVLQILILGV